MEQPVEQRGDGRGVAEELAPVLDGAVRSDQGRRFLIPAHHEFQEVLGGRLRELPHPEIVDDEQRDGRDVGDVLLAGAGGLGLGEVVEEGMRFAVEDAVALLDHREADGLGHVAFAAPGRAQKQRVRMLRDPAGGCGPRSWRTRLHSDWNAS